MSTEGIMHQDHTGAQYARGKLFLLSVIALVTAGMVNSLRASSLAEMENVFFKVSDPLHSAQLIGAIAGAAFLGFAISIFIGSPLCDSLGMGKLLGLASILHIAGTIMTLVSRPGPMAYVMLFAAMLTVGLAHGLVEAVINPLIATLYPDDKTHKLNVLHAWWPGGIIIGGLIAYAFDQMHLGWQMKLGVILVPAAIYGLGMFGTKFPPTERVAAGVSSAEMWREAMKPLFVVLFFCMLLTASSELGPGQWVDLALTRLVHFQGILLLVYVSALMFVMRHFAGHLAHRLSPIGLMWVSCLLAAVGLWMLSMATSMVTGLVAATVWGIGVCYMWPTMLGITSERFPKGGAVLMGLMGCAGNIAIYFLLPQMGQIYDGEKVRVAMAEVNAMETKSATDEKAKAGLKSVYSVVSLNVREGVQKASQAMMVAAGPFQAVGAKAAALEGGAGAPPPAVGAPKGAGETLQEAADAINKAADGYKTQLEGAATSPYQALESAASHDPQKVTELKSAAQAAGFGDPESLRKLREAVAAAKPAQVAAFEAAVKKAGGPAKAQEALDALGKQDAAAQNAQKAVSGAITELVAGDSNVEAAYERTRSAASSKSFRMVSFLPAVLLIVFGLWWLSDKKRGGYKAVRLDVGQGPTA